MKRSTTEFGSVLRPFLPVFPVWDNLLKILELRLCPQSLQWIPILVASNNISKNRLVHRRYPSVHFDKYQVRNTCFKVFHFTKNYPTTWRALKIKLSLRKVSENCQKKSLYLKLFVAKFQIINLQRVSSAVKFRLVTKI